MKVNLTLSVEMPGFWKRKQGSFSSLKTKIAFATF
jgi:hypothetical protein